MPTATPKPMPTTGQQVQTAILPLIQTIQSNIINGTAQPADYQNLANYIIIWNYYSSQIQGIAT